MDGIPELLGRWRIGIVIAEIHIVGFVAVRAPMAFVLARVGIENDHAVIAVTVSDEDFVCFLVDEGFRRSAEIFSIVAAFALPGFADLHQEFSCLRELQDHGIIGAHEAAGLTFFLHLSAGGTLTSTLSL